MGQKDLTQKNLEYYPDVFADIINALLYEGKQVLLPEELQPAPTETLYHSKGGQLRNQFHDISKYKMQNGKIRFQYTIENETRPDKRLILRKAGYEGAVYREQFDRKTQEIYPVISMVLYWGKGRRRIVKDLHGLFSKEVLTNEAIRYIGNTELHLYDMRYLPEEIRERFHSDMRIVADYLAEGKDYQPTSQPVIHIQEFLLLMKEISGDTRYEQMITQLEEEKNTGGMTMCELLDKYENRGIEKGMKRGMEEGVKEGMKKGMKEGVKEGMKKGMKEGVKKGLQQGIKALVETCQDFGLTQTETLEKVLQKFSISRDESRECIQMYWHV